MLYSKIGWVIMEKGGVRKRLLLLFLSLVFLSASAFSDSFTFDTGIYGITFGPNDFGMNLFPAGTHFGYYHDFQMYKGASYKARLRLDVEFILGNAYLDGLYNDLTGEPKYLHRVSDIDKEDYYTEGSYFNPNAYLNIYLDQPFDIPWGDDWSWTFDVRFGLRTRYYMALENLNAAIYGLGDESPAKLLFVDKEGKDIPPFGPDSYIQAYPWLSGNRNTWNSYLFLYTYYDWRTPRGFEAYDGFYAELSVEYGPFWLLNNITPSFATSDFYKFTGYLEERWTLYSLEQDNGWNWVNIQLIHTNEASYTGGDVVPEAFLPTDRLSASFNDRIALMVIGPQFLVSDCYPYAELSLDNSVYFGSVVNDKTNSGFVWEVQSYAELELHLKLFGFIQLEYSVQYKFFSGIWPDYPQFSQDAAVKFYISI